MLKFKVRHCTHGEKITVGYDRLYARLKKLEESSQLNNIQGIYTLLKEIVPEAKIGNRS